MSKLWVTKDLKKSLEKSLNHENNHYTIYKSVWEIRQLTLDVKHKGIVV